MSRLLATLAMLLAFGHAHATQLDETLCKERPELCPERRQPAPKNPEKKPEPPKSQAPSGPGWTLIEGEKHESIQNYLLQVATNTNYRNCNLKGEKIQAPSGFPWANLKYMLYGRILELNNNSERPLFRIQYGSGSDYFKYETFVTTNRDRTQILNIAISEYTEPESSYYTGTLDNPQLVKLKPKLERWSLNCDAN